MTTAIATLPTTYPWQSVPVDLAPLAPVEYCGWQEGFGPIPGFHLWTLTEEIPGFALHSSVDAKTLQAAGFRLPHIPAK